MIKDAIYDFIYSIFGPIRISNNNSNKHILDCLGLPHNRLIDAWDCASLAEASKLSFNSLSRMVKIILTDRWCRHVGR